MSSTYITSPTQACRIIGATREPFSSQIWPLGHGFNAVSASSNYTNITCLMTPFSVLMPHYTPSAPVR